MAYGADIDIYADVDHEFAQEENNGYGAVDLYDDMLQPSARQGNTSRRSSSNGLNRNMVNNLQYNYQGKKVSIYIGNLTWWTTDQDLQNAIASLGVTDLIEIKFYENKANGQSKGFAVVHLASEASSWTIMEKLPQKDIHGQSPAVTPCNRQSLDQFEQQSKTQSGSATPSKPPTPAPTPRPPQFSNPPPSLPNNANPAVSWPPQSAVSRSQTSILGSPPVQLQRPPGLPFPPPPITTPKELRPVLIRHASAQLRSPLAINVNVPPPRPGMPMRGMPPGIPPPGLPPHGLGHTLVSPPPGLPPPGLGPPRGPPPGLGPPPNLAAVRMQPPPQMLILPPNSIQGINVNTRLPPPIGVPPPSLISQLASVQRPAPGPPPAGPPPAGPPPHILQPQLVESAPQDNYDSRSQSPPLSEVEVEEIMIRNRAVSSSAISRAVADASSGDYGIAIETLVTAISLIKQSKVASDEHAKVLIGSLQDCLHGIEEKSFGSGTERKRDRSRDREGRSRHRESKSRRRERDRDRDHSRSRDRYDEREYRDRSRDRDSGGGSYSRHSDRHRR